MTGRKLCLRRMPRIIIDYLSDQRSQEATHCRASYTTLGTESKINPPLLNDIEISFFAVGNLINFANENDREGFFEVIQSPIVASKIMKGIEKIAPTEGESVSLEPSDQRNIAPIVIQPAAKAHVIE